VEEGLWDLRHILGAGVVEGKGKEGAVDEAQLLAISFKKNINLTIKVTFGTGQVTLLTRWPY